MNQRFQDVWNETCAGLDANPGITPEWAKPSRGRVAFAIVHGSHCYGTATPTSDFDLRGILSPPKRHVLGFAKKFEQLESRDPHDLVLYDIRKFCQLASQCNPNIIEVLFAPDECILVESPIGVVLRKERNLFLSKKIRHTFSGYAASQLKRIQAHRRWLLNPPEHAPIRTEWNLPEQGGFTKAEYDVVRALVQKRLDTWSLNLDGLDESTRIDVLSQLSQAVDEIGFGLQIHSDRIYSSSELLQVAAQGIELQHLSKDALKLFDRERRYREAQREWTNFQRWKLERNPSRADLEAKFGFDTKHAMHLVRLLRMCAEILQTGQVRVRRPDAEELLAIRQGAWTYDQLMDYATKMDHDMESLEKTSKLPKTPNLDKLDLLCATLVEHGMYGSDQ